MLFTFMGQCAPDAAYLPISSLNEVCTDLEGNPIEIGDLLEDPSADVEGQVEQIQLYLKLDRFLQTLPPRTRDIVYRHYWLNETQVDIAADLGVTRSAVCHALAKVARDGKAFFQIS